MYFVCVVNVFLDAEIHSISKFKKRQPLATLRIAMQQKVDDQMQLESIVKCRLQLFESGSIIRKRKETRLNTFLQPASV